MPPSVELQEPRPSARWDYTDKAREEGVDERRRQQERASGRGERPTISRDSRIDGGVYEGAYGGEAIVVDGIKYPTGLRAAFEYIMPKIRQSDGTIDKAEVLDTVFETVTRMMRYDASAVDRILAKAGGQDGTKIALDAYVMSGVGVCRHQALFAGQILESLADMGYVGGKASVERNIDRRSADDKYDGHSWVRYTNSGGQVFIMDIAHGKLGSLDSLMAARARGEAVWDYARPEDYAARRGHMTLDVLDVRQPITDDQKQEAVKTHEDLRQELLAGLSEADKNALLWYARSLDDKAQAQRAGNGEGSQLAGQRAGQYYKQLSREAQAIASRFVSLR